jgi:choline monooxygenase
MPAMDRETELGLIDATLAHIDEGRPSMDEGSARLDVERYLSVERLARERALFRRWPLLVGFSSQLAEPGSFVTHTESDVPILITRDGDGVLRAFLNACRHRGTLVEAEACGAGRKRFTCPYHNWTYDLAGRLRGLPHAYGFPDLDRDARGLVELPVAERFGAVFAVPTAGGAFDFDAYFGALGGEVDGMLRGHVRHAPTTRERALNWKLMLDGSFEGYHFRFAHERTIAPMFCDNVAHITWSEPHARLILPKRSMKELHGVDRGSWRLRDHANVIYAFFPNTLVLVQPDHAMVLSAWPKAPDKSVLTGAMLVPEAPADARAERHWQKNEEIFWTAIEEDIDMGQRIQRTLGSGANDHLLFGRFEHLVVAFHAFLDRML